MIEVYKYIGRGHGFVRIRADRDTLVNLGVVAEGDTVNKALVILDDDGAVIGQKIDVQKAPKPRKTKDEKPTE